MAENSAVNPSCKDVN